MALSRSGVEVGYLEKGDAWKLESRFFPSKVGGKPAWLDLKNIPGEISCGNCRKPCIFLCQLYTPIAKGYRRTVYVFICRDPKCCRMNKNDNFVVLRCQIPVVNEFYVKEEPIEDQGWHPESNIHFFNSICAVCGCLGSHQCSKCKSTKYCSREHQVLDWKTGHNSLCGTDAKNEAIAGLLFPEYEILTEPEIMDDDDEALIRRRPEKSEEEILKEYEALLAEGGLGTMNDIPAEVLEMLSLGKEEKYIKYFKERLKICQDQVVRYDRGGDPLWIAEPNIKEKDIPRCEICGGPRIFEFEVLPTLLSHLEVDSLGDSIDWGILLIYTCKYNCNEGDAYKREFLWKQDII